MTRKKEIIDEKDFDNAESEAEFSPEAVLDETGQTGDVDDGVPEEVEAGDAAADAMLTGDAVIDNALARLADQESALTLKLKGLDALAWDKFNDLETAREQRNAAEKELRREALTAKLADRSALKLSAIVARKQQLIDNAEAYKAEQAEKAQEKIDAEKKKIAEKLAKKERQEEAAAAKKLERQSAQASVKAQKTSENAERKAKLDARKAELENFPGRRRKATQFIYSGEGLSAPQQYSIRGKIYQYLKDNYNFGDHIDVEIFGAEVKSMLYGANVRSYLGKLEETGQVDFVTPVDVPIETSSAAVPLHDDFDGDVDPDDEGQD